MRLLIVLIAFCLLLMVIGGILSWNAERRFPPIGAFVTVDGQKLHYIDVGPLEFQASDSGATDTARPPIVLFHGASANLKDMKLALGDRLSQNTRVIIFDRPGRGYSTRPSDGYKLNVQARLMHDALAQLGVEDPIILGQSLGGAVALSYALQYQDEISGLVLLASVSHEWPGDPVWYNKASAIPILGTILRRAVVPIYGEIVAAGGIDGAFWPRRAPENYAEEIGLSLLFRPGDFKNNAADVYHLKSQIVDMLGQYDDIRVPTLIYVGTHDTTVSPTIHSYNLSREIVNSTLTIIPFVGHGLHHTSKEEILKGVEGLIATIGQGRLAIDNDTSERDYEGDAKNNTATDVKTTP